MNIIPADTTIDAAVKQFEVLRRMTLQERATITFELIDNLRGIAEAGIRSRHPDYDDDKVKLALLRLTLGEKLFQDVFGDKIIEV
ncbi:hypothetical protein ACFL1G_04640 [Planctomycetota bacterium]